jgi:hypothetical protein
MSVAMLDDELLAEFENALYEAGAAITSVWSPGLSDVEIDRLAAPHGLVLPEEARRWWRWHNGFDESATAGQWEITPRRTLIDLATALEEFAERRAELKDVYDADAWIQLAGDEPYLFFDVAGPAESPVAVYVGGHGELPRLELPSIGELVSRWTDLIRSKAFITNPDGTWAWDYDRIPPDVQQLGIY